MPVICSASVTWWCVTAFRLPSSVIRLQTTLERKLYWNISYFPSLSLSLPILFPSIICLLSQYQYNPPQTLVRQKGVFSKPARQVEPVCNQNSKKKFVISTHGMAEGMILYMVIYSLSQYLKVWGQKKLFRDDKNWSKELGWIGIFSNIGCVKLSIIVEILEFV